MTKEKKKDAKKKKKFFQEEFGVVNCHFSFNNTIINFSKPNGEVVFWYSSGKLGFKGTKKSTAYVAEKVADKVILEILEYGVSKIVLKVKKMGLGRGIVIKRFLKEENNFSVLKLIDFTSIRLGGGTRPKKKPRK